MNDFSDKEYKVFDLFKEKRIDGVININRVWLIPRDIMKPTDKKYKMHEKG